jgi:hypothetical protein
MTFLPKPCLGRGTMRSMVEGYSALSIPLHHRCAMVPLPIHGMGRI